MCDITTLTTHRKGQNLLRGALAEYLVDDNPANGDYVKEMVVALDAAERAAAALESELATPTGEPK